ncbi:MAG: class I SAM-dependent methyltransferase, partial [Candidatus Omnitrophica bacterium]|nr:class I SAM-dependent methyltransferase [Candidatus Omnitrophota bacterium]
GTYYFSESAKEATGIDYDETIINYAKNKYQKGNLKFCVFDIKNLHSFSNKFDVVCSFQVIEHLRETENFLINLKDLLEENGTFICSTPNRLDASPGSKFPLNKFHIQEYLLAEFKELLERYFEKVELFGLKRGRKLNLYRRLKKIGLFNFFPTSMNPVKKFYDRIDYTDFIIVKDKLNTALDFIAVCRDYKNRIID